MIQDRYASIELSRDCDATLIPGGQQVTLREGEHVVLTQALGGSYTIETDSGYLARISAEDGDALGLEAPVPGAAHGDEPGAGAVPTGDFELSNVIEQLKTVFDPEIPVNVVDLGLIYSCDAEPLPAGGHRVEIKMSMTAPGCGMGDILRDDAIARVRTLPGVAEVDVELVWDPPWEPSRMSDAAKLQLGML